VDPTGYSASSSAVVPFQQGAQSAAKQVGQIQRTTRGAGHDRQRNDRQQGDRSCAGRLPGGVVDRVVQLSNGEYEVHTIGVNWPHHVFVDQNFQVVGAN